MIGCFSIMNYDPNTNVWNTQDRPALDICIRQIEQKVTDAKGTIEELLFLLDLQNKAPWPEMLEKMSSLASSMSSLESLLKNRSSAGSLNIGELLRTHVLVPHQLSLDVDEELKNLTQSRVHSFNHDLVPDYLRTKADTEHEKEEEMLEQERMSKGPVEQCVKQTLAMNKHIEWFTHSKLSDATHTSENAVEQAYSREETERIVRAICGGHGLERQRQAPSVVQTPTQATGAHPMQTHTMPGYMGMPGHTMQQTPVMMHQGMPMMRRPPNQ